MFEFMPSRRPHAQFEQRGNVPSDHDGRGDEPAKRGVSNHASEPVHWRVSQKRHQSATNEGLREAVQQRDRGRSEQKQRGRYCHQQKMLRHVGGKQMMIHTGKGRSACGPR
jgi:hypothetical protein